MNENINAWHSAKNAIIADKSRLYVITGAVMIVSVFILTINYIS